MAQRNRSAPLKPSKSRAALGITHPNAAGIDIGSASHFVAVPPDRDDQPVREFASFTADLHALADWLTSCGVDTVGIGMPRGDASARVQGSPPARSDEDVLVHLAPVDVAKLAQVLVRMPAPLIAACLQVRRWPWQGALLERLPVELRHEVRGVLDPGNGSTRADAPRLRAALARALLRQLEPSSTLAGDPAAVAQGLPALPRTRGWFRKWLKGRR